MSAQLRHLEDRMAEQPHTGITRREMIGIGGAGALAGLAVAGLPLTAAAAPVRNHVAAWGPVFQDLGPTIPNLTYVNVAGTAFWPLSNPSDRYVEPDSRLVGIGAGGLLVAPLDLPAGSTIQQISFGYRVSASADATVRIMEQPLDAGQDPSDAPTPVAVAVGPGADAVVSSVTVNLATPAVIKPNHVYTVELLTVVGMTLRGVSVGYMAPTAGFVPFAGATPRVLDTREGAGTKVAADQEITVDLGNAGVRGALVNVTVTETEGLGFAAMFDASIAYPGNSSVNWAAPGATVANGVVSAVAADGTVKIRVGGLATAKAHVIVDRLGWFI